MCEIDGINDIPDIEEKSSELEDIIETIQNKIQRKIILNMHRVSGMCSISKGANNMYLTGVPETHTPSQLPTPTHI